MLPQKSHRAAARKSFVALALRTHESLPHALVRSIQSEIEKALERLGYDGRRGGRRASKAVHEVRKHFKIARGTLQLLRNSLGDDVYREESCCFRDASRPLAILRDASVLPETLDEVAPKSMAIRDALLANEKEVMRRVLHDERAFAAAREVAAAALIRLQTWALEGGVVTVEEGVQRVYRSGRRALALAKTAPTSENLHGWRKRAQYLRRVLELLARSGGLARKARELSRLLGDDHDLAVLRQILALDPQRYGGQEAIEPLLEAIERRRANLQEQAFVVGRRLYRDPPKRFARRLGVRRRAA